MRDELGAMLAPLYSRCDDLAVKATCDQWWRVRLTAWVGSREVVAIADSTGPLDPMAAFEAAVRSLDRQLSAVAA